MSKTFVYLILGAIVALTLGCITLIARGHDMVMIDGVLQHGFEKSDFYDRGDCSRKPWWFDVSEADHTLHEQWDSLGRPRAVRIRFVGNVSSIGRHGHLGHYRREVVAVHVLEVSPSRGCAPIDGQTQ
jgi:hypothetical protein